MLRVATRLIKQPVAKLNFSSSSGFQASLKVEHLTKQITIINNDESQKSPLVILFGWGNGKLKHLRKYSKIFEEKNFTIVCVTTTLLNSLLRTSSAGRKETENVRIVFSDLLSVNPERPVILFPFSNAGCAIYCLLTENWNSESLPGANVKGTIFDSCPIVPNVESVAIVQRAFGQMQNVLVRTMIAPILRWAVLHVVNNNSDVKSFMYKMERSKITSPQLFLFSSNDELAPSKDIREFIQKRELLGVDVSFKEWEDSEHVGHFKKYPKDYERNVDELVKKCLN